MLQRSEKAQAAPTDKASSESEVALNYWKAEGISSTVKCQTRGHGHKAAVFKKSYCPECCVGMYAMPRYPKRRY
jgi:hypothetical protein